MIDRDTIDKIMEATNIVDVVSEFVTLRKAGINYKGLCPFHDDKTPSFMVSPTKGICHCFACGKGGNAVNFLMEHEQITYPDALRWLAKKYNIEIQERELSAEEKQQANDRESMYIVNEWARGYFEDILKKNPDGQAIGLQYFRSRGIRDDIIEKFKLGYALPKRDALSRAAVAAGYKEDYLVKTGLCYRRDNGELVDRYAGRVIFPWFSVAGKVNAFGGRLLDSRTKGVQQKYVNSPESDIFHKERELYGLYQAKRDIAKQDHVYMVEGYTDVIAMHQCGICNVVANSGTALSIHQIKALRRFTSNITLLYDGDEAGIHAAMRGTDMLLAEGMNVKVLLLPDGDDPDSFSRKHSAEEFRKYIEDNQTDFIRFKSDVMLRGVNDPIKRSEAITNIVRSISVIPNQITRDTYVHECADRLQINEQTLINTMNSFIRGDIEAAQKDQEREARRQASEAPASGVPNPSPIAPASDNPIEVLLVQLILQHGGDIIYNDVKTADGEVINLTVAQFIDYDLSQDNLHFSNPIYQTILTEAAAHSGDEGFDPAAFFASYHDIEVSSVASRLTFNKYQLCRSLEMKPDEEAVRLNTIHLLSEFRAHTVQNMLNALKRRLAEAQRAKNGDEVRAILKEMMDARTLRDTIADSVGQSLVRNL
ncbi:MAG: DNA primase [Prevotellaceae bacterium]|nr:DNA primase [Prevotellaceae bacterium]